MRKEVNATVDVVWQGEVEQTTHGGQVAKLYKEIVRIPSEAPLVAVRKHLLGGATKPPVVLVHGLAQNRYSWHTTQRSYSAWLAAEGWDVWNLELRGHGRSREAEDELEEKQHTVGRGAESFDDYCEDVIACARALPSRAFWMGHSMGGGALYGAATRIDAQ